MTDVVGQLKRLKPYSLRVTLRDGTDRPVAVPKAGNRWQRAERTLESLDWETIECLDKDSRVLGVIESPEDDEGEEFDGETPSGEVHKMAKIMLEVMRSTQKETRQMFEVQMRGQQELVTALIEGVRSVSDSYSLAMKVQATNQAMESGGDSEVTNMLKMAMAMQMQQKHQPKQVPAPAPVPGVTK